MIIVRKVISGRANFGIDQDLRDAIDEANRKYRENYQNFEPPKFNFDFVEKKSQRSPKLLLAGLASAAAVGAGAYFTRRRKSKNGKQIIERVRR